MSNRIRDWTQAARDLWARTSPAFRHLIERSAGFIATVALVLSLSAMSIGLVAVGRVAGESQARLDATCQSSNTFRSKVSDLANLLEDLANRSGRPLTDDGRKLIVSIRDLADQPSPTCTTK